MRSKTALLLALIFKHAGASLWQSAVPDMLQFGRQSPAHTRTVRPARWVSRLVLPNSES